jgi:hypothetical protein
MSDSDCDKENSLAETEYSITQKLSELKKGESIIFERTLSNDQLFPYSISENFQRSRNFKLPRNYSRTNLYFTDSEAFESAHENSSDMNLPALDNTAQNNRCSIEPLATLIAKLGNSIESRYVMNLIHKMLVKLENFQFENKTDDKESMQTFVCWLIFNLSFVVAKSLQPHLEIIENQIKFLNRVEQSAEKLERAEQKFAVGGKSENVSIFSSALGDCLRNSDTSMLTHQIKDYFGNTNNNSLVIMFKNDYGQKEFLENIDLDVYNLLINANSALPNESKMSFYAFIGTHVIQDLIGPDSCIQSEISANTKATFFNCLTCSKYLKEPNGKMFKLGGSNKSNKKISLANVVEFNEKNNEFEIVDLKNRDHMGKHFKMDISRNSSDQVVRFLNYIKYFMVMWPTAYDLVNLAEFDFAAAVDKYFSDYESVTIEDKSFANNLDVMIQYIKSSNKLDLLETSYRAELLMIMDIICHLGDVDRANDFIENVMVNLKKNYDHSIIKFTGKFAWDRPMNGLSLIVKPNDLKENYQLFIVSIFEYL